MFKVGLNLSWVSHPAWDPPDGSAAVNPADTDARVIGSWQYGGGPVAASQVSANLARVCPMPAGPWSPPLRSWKQADGSSFLDAAHRGYADQVRVTRTFDAQGRPNLETIRCLTVLMVAVRPSAALAVSIEGAAQDGSPLGRPRGDDAHGARQPKSAIYKALPAAARSRLATDVISFVVRQPVSESPGPGSTSKGMRSRTRS